MAQRPDALAVEGASWLLSYRDLDRESARIAAELHRLGVGPGHQVPLLMQRSPAFVVAMLGVVRCGAAYAPIDLANPAARQRLILQGLNSPVALADAQVLPNAAQDRPRQWLDPLRLLTQASSTPAPAWPSGAPDTPLYAMFTSGSTGSPKGVLVPQRGVLRLVHQADYADFPSNSRWAQWSSLAFDASTLEIWGPLLNGATCVIQEAVLPSLDALGHFLLEREITDAWLTAALFNALVDEQVQSLAGLRQLLTGGERASPAHMRRFLHACPQVRLINGYGPTENTTFSLCHSVELADLESSAGVPIGRPIRGTLAHVVGADGQAVGEGQIGELWVSGTGVALGYLNDPTQTTARFLSYQGQNFYRTGDLVSRRLDGVVEFHGRNDRQVKIQGKRIELEEIERVLLGAPGVGQVVALVRGDSAEARHLVVAYSGREGRPPPAAALKLWAEAHLPAAMVPHVMHAVPRMPINLSGKLDMRALQALIDSTPGYADTGPNELGSETETRLARIWQRHLGQMPMTGESDFMAIGGTSLLALRVAAQAQREFGRAFDPIDLLRHPKLSDAAQLLEQARPIRPDIQVPGDDQQAVPLTRAQEALINASSLDPSGCAYLVHVGWLIGPQPGTNALRDALQQLAERHPILRTHIQHGAQGLRAVVTPLLSADWWQQHEPLARPWSGDGEWPQDILLTLRQPLDLAAASMRADLWPLGPQRWLLVWTVHHFAIDEASIAHARTELSSMLLGRALEPVYGSPFAFHTLEQTWTDEAAAQVVAADLVYVLAGQKPPLDLPPGLGHEAPLALPEALMENVALLPQRWGGTLFTPLMVAWGMALQDTFGAAWRYVATPFSKRLEPEMVDPMGYLLDLRLIESGARTAEAPRTTIERVHAAWLDAQAPRMVPMDRVADLVQNLSPSTRECLTQFALTWRLDTEGDFELGPGRVRQLQVPMGAARFGLCLHVQRNGTRLQARLEGLSRAFESGLAARAGAAFMARLSELCALSGAAMPQLNTRTALSAEPAVSPEAGQGVRLARAQWQRWLGTAPASWEADFLLDGGSSLLAMRMAASLRAESGLRIEVGEFLAQPSFARLCELLVGPGPAQSPLWTLVGPDNCTHKVLVIPGWRGSALGMFDLAQALRSRLPADHGVVIVDLREIMHRAPHQDYVWFFRQQLQRVVKEVGLDDIRAVLGFSLGGLLAAQLFVDMPEMTRKQVKLWLMDTYAASAMDKRPTHVALRNLVAAVRSPGLALKTLLGPKQAGRSPADDAVAGNEAPRWRAFLQELARQDISAPAIHAVLVRSTGSAKRMGLLRRSGTNGWHRNSFGGLEVFVVQAEHDDLRRARAADVAALLIPT